MIVGTAGHIDHGKTLLVKALTGVDTDRLKEEKARGITIELGFAYTPLPDGSVLGFVDVPGHERFIHTMLAGVSGIDFVLLVIAADDGMMPQTREHLEIIDLLGIREGVVVLSKIDLVDTARRRAVEVEIRQALAGSTLAGADIYPVSATINDGITDLKQRLEEEAQSRPARDHDGVFRMAIDRSFTLQGTGTVVTGTVMSGRVQIGDSVTVLPKGLEARVRSIHAQNRAATEGHAGQRCALNLAGPAISKDAISRGDWLVDPARATQTDRIDVTLQLLSSAPRALKTWQPVYFHLGTSALPARLVLLSSDTLAPGESALAQIVLPAPIPARHGDRFVLRDIGAEHTIGGGRVIDPRAPARKRRSGERLAVLDAMRTDEASAALTALLSLPPFIVDTDAFAADRGLTDKDVARLIEQLNLVALGETGARYVTTQTALEQLGESIATMLARFHADNPALPGMPDDRLRRALTQRFTPSVFRPLLDALAARNAVASAAGIVRLPSHDASLNAEEARLWDRVRPLIAAERYRSPTAREIGQQIGMPVANVRKLCKALTRMDELVEISTDRFLLRAALSELGAMAQELAAESDTKMFSTIAFKDRAACGRNAAIEILEYFDRRGITIRQNEMRRIVKDPAAVLGRL